MRRLITSLLMFFVFSNVLAGSLAERTFHGSPQPVIRGENARIEIQLFDTQMYFRDARVFYRQNGEADFESKELISEGYLHYTDIPTAKMSPGVLEYYFAFETGSGAVFTLPEMTASSAPFHLEVLPEAKNNYEDQSNLEILILSPENNESVPLDELLIALSIPVDNVEIDHDRTRLLIDGVNISTLLTHEGNLYQFTPKTIRTGYHNAEFKIFDSNGNTLGKVDWSFRVTGVSENYSGFRTVTNIFLDNRSQNISNKSRNLFRGGFNFRGNYESFSMRVFGMASSVDAYDGQPENRLGIQAQYLFSPTSKIYIKGGNFSGHYDPLVYWDRRILGFGGGIQFKYFALDITAGQTASGVEGTFNDDTQSITRSGRYKQTFLGIRPVFKFGSHVDLGLHLVNGKDDPESIKYGSNPREELVVGTALNLDFDNHRTVINASVNASIANNDAVGEVDFDTLAEKYELTGSERDMAKTFVDLMDATGFLSLTQGLSPLPNVAMKLETRLNYFNHNLRVSYRNIDANYSTPGNPYLQKGISGVFITDNIRLVRNQVYLNLHFKAYKDNLSQELAETSNTDVGATISYFPFKSLPSITLMYGNLSRKNDIDPTNSAESLYYAEDNSTQRIMVSSSYNFSTGGLSNTATLSISNFARDDAISEINKSDFTLYSFGLRNRFSFPLSTQVGYTSSSSIFGANISESTTDINKYFAGVNYNLRDVLAKSNLKPFFNFTYQTIENQFTTINQDYSRMNYTAGIYVRNKVYGNLTFRYDLISYGDRDDIDWNDSILSTRYEINF